MKDKMASLFDSDDSSSCSEKSLNNVESHIGLQTSDDDATTFTVATVLEKRRGSRRDTITRTMPTISIHDKYDIPNTVQKKQIEKQEERTQLRITSSLMDDSSDSEHDDGKLERDSHAHLRNSEAHLSGFASDNSHEEDNFRTPSQDDQTIDVSSTKSTVVRRNAAKQTNLLDIEVENEAIEVENETIEVDINPKNSKRNNRRHSADTFMSVYEDLAFKNKTPAKPHTEKLESKNAAAKGTHVKKIVTTALKSVADGLAAHATSNSCDGVGPWDVEDTQQLSGRKRAIGFDGRSDTRQRNRRKSLNIRAELNLLQDRVDEKAEECDSLKRKLEDAQSQIEALRDESSIIVQSKVILESKLDVAKEARRVAETNASSAQVEADDANARVESLSSQLRDSRSEIEELAMDLEVQRQKNDETSRSLQNAESELNMTKQQLSDANRERDSMKSRAELQQEIDKMRIALKDIRELESVRMKKSQRTEAELRGAHNALANANSTAEALKRENVSLCAQLKQREDSVGKWRMEWEEGTEGIELKMSDAVTPKTTNIDNINTLGAEDVANGSEMSNNDSKLPLKAVLRGTPDSSSRQLTFSSTKPSAGKENNQCMNAQQPECSLCYRPPRPNGVIKSCQCGKDNCRKWAHASCLVHMKSVSSCVSHPGTPGPPLPTILCGGIWGETNEI